MWLIVIFPVASTEYETMTSRAAEERSIQQKAFPRFHFLRARSCLSNLQFLLAFGRVNQRNHEFTTIRGSFCTFTPPWHHSTVLIFYGCTHLEASFPSTRSDHWTQHVHGSRSPSHLSKCTWLLIRCFLRERHIVNADNVCSSRTARCGASPAIGCSYDETA